jgi:hypothetical protein
VLDSAKPNRATYFDIIPAHLRSFDGNPILAAFWTVSVGYP